jgi:tetratricopeptide (TPR) repeat protein
MPSNSASPPNAHRARIWAAQLCLLALCAALLGSLASSSARAQNDDVNSDERTRAARALFDAGTIAFRQGRYEDALGNFEQAYRLTHDPVLLFNVATSLDRLRRDAEAVKQFRAYLEAMPDAPNRSAVEGRIALLSRGAPQDSAPVTPAPAPEPPPPPVVVPADPPPPVVEPRKESASYKVLPRWVVWSGVGLTAVMGGVALWSGLDTLSAADDYEDKPTRKAYDDGQHLEKRTNALIFSAAGVGVLTAVAAVFTDWHGEDSSEKQAKRRPHWGVWADRTGAGAKIEAAF